jgi:predicted transcriptional regulator
MRHTRVSQSLSEIVVIRVNPYTYLTLTLQGLTMSKLMELIKALIPGFKTQHEIDEAFLSESSDACDLQRRMRLMDKDARDSARGLVFGNLMP